MSRKTEFKGTAASRRRARRANLQSQEAISSDKLHRPTPSRVVLQCKLKPAMRAEVITLTTLTRKYEGNLSSERSSLRGRLPEIKTTDGEMINSFANYLFLPCLS